MRSTIRKCRDLTGQLGGLRIEINEMLPGVLAPIGKGEALKTQSLAFLRLAYKEKALSAQSSPASV
ncbi:MAG: hypothetical protein C5B51_31115 [Terriglobia bacterium]|nr:MAG: hypothetical protein C5B51_31115 [Terriglobia bacterium]